MPRSNTESVSGVTPATCAFSERPPRSVTRTSSPASTSCASPLNEPTSCAAAGVARDTSRIQTPDLVISHLPNLECVNADVGGSGPRPWPSASFVKSPGGQIGYRISRRSDESRLPTCGLQPLVDPRDEQHVAQAGMDVRRAREQRVGKRVAKAPEAHLVERALLVEEVQDTAHPVPVAGRQVDPRQRRLHFVTTPAPGGLPPGRACHGRRVLAGRSSLLRLRSCHGARSPWAPEGDRPVRLSSVTAEHYPSRGARCRVRVSLTFVSEPVKAGPSRREHRRTPVSLHLGNDGGVAVMGDAQPAGQLSEQSAGVKHGPGREHCRARRQPSCGNDRLRGGYVGPRSDQRALAGRGAALRVHVREVALPAGWRGRVVAAVGLVGAGRHVGDQLDQGGGFDRARGAREPDDPAGDLLQVRQADAVLQVAVAEPGDLLVRVVSALLEQGGEGGVEVDDDVVDGPAVVDAPTVLEELGEVEVGRGEPAVEPVGVGDAVEAEGPQLLALVAVPDQVPGVLTVEDAVRDRRRGAPCCRSRGSGSATTPGRGRGRRRSAAGGGLP